MGRYNIERGHIGGTQETPIKGLDDEQGFSDGNGGCLECLGEISAVLFEARSLVA